MCRRVCRKKRHVRRVDSREALESKDALSIKLPVVSGIFDLYEVAVFTAPPKCVVQSALYGELIQRGAHYASTRAAICQKYLFRVFVAVCARFEFEPNAFEEILLRSTRV